MRRDRQMFLPRQLLHAAATRGEAASDLPKKERKERRKEEDERRKEEKSIFPSLLCSALSTPSSPWEQREKERAREAGPLRRIDTEKKGSQHPRKRVDRPYLEERNP